MIRPRREGEITPPDPGAVESVIGKGTEVKGELKSQHAIRIDGRLEGSAETAADIIVGESGVVVANLHGASILIAGDIQGQVKAEKRLEITASGRVHGDVEAPVLVVNEGGRLDGKCTMTVTGATSVPPRAAGQAAAARERSSPGPAPA